MHHTSARPDQRSADLEAALAGYEFSEARRHGKVLFVRASSGWQLAMHFGMTGLVALYDDPAAEPGHARLVLRFADGARFAYDGLTLELD